MPAEPIIVAMDIVRGGFVVSAGADRLSFSRACDAAAFVKNLVLNAESQMCLRTKSAAEVYEQHGIMSNAQVAAELGFRPEDEPLRSSPPARSFVARFLRSLGARR